jgi:hypothetical protein
MQPKLKSLDSTRCRPARLINTRDIFSLSPLARCREPFRFNHHERFAFAIQFLTDDSHDRTDQLTAFSRHQKNVIRIFLKPLEAYFHLSQRRLFSPKLFVEIGQGCKIILH